MAWVATGASLLGTGFGIYQGINNQSRADKAQTRIDKLAANSPIYKPDKSIHDYYQLALNRYNENPFQSAGYAESIKQANRTAANTLKAGQSRGAAIGMASKINQMVQDQKDRAIGGAIQNKNSQFSQLGGATNMQGSQTAKAFDINQMTPYKTRLGVDQMQMASANEQAGVGFQNAAVGVSNIAALGAKGLYKDYFDDRKLAKATKAAAAVKIPVTKIT
jgi:hypothetical protein